MVSMSSKPLAPSSGTSSRLSREDWINAAYAAVVEGGFSAVRVLTLAEAIGVTRGSFYWHFGSQSELVEALIDRWCAAESERQRAAATTRPGDARQALKGWLQALTETAPDSNFPHLRFGLALRTFASRNAAAAQRLAEVDRARLDMLQKVFQDLVADPVRARRHAVAYYLAMGGMALSMSNKAFDPALSQEMIDSIIQTTVPSHGPAA